MAKLYLISLIALFLCYFSTTGLCEDVLEQRIEILEKNDISQFLEKPKYKKQNKREIDDYCSDDEHDQDEPNENNNCKNEYKRENNNEDTTEIHEYGISNKKLDIANEDASKIGEQDDTVTSFGKNTNKRNVASNKERNINNDKNERVKRNFMDFGKGFLGIDWTQFFLAPDEIADKAIETEQMIEEHNKKNRK